jgi:hypothetical protein
MTPEKEKVYIKKEVQTITKICSSPPKGWYYGGYRADLTLAWEVYKEMDVPLLWDSDS